MKIFMREEKGSAIIMVALMMVVLSGFAALAIDGGNLYYRHTRLQDIADACALAAGHQYGEEEGDNTQKQSAAFDKAVDYANKNGLTTEPGDSTYSEKILYKGEPGTMNVSFLPDTYEVTVDISVDSNLYFARVLGFSQTPVNVSATVKLEMAEEYTSNLVPICFEEGLYETYETGMDVPLTFGPGDGCSGNYNYLDYKPSDEFDEYILNGYDGTLEVGDDVYTMTGIRPGRVDPYIDERIARCTAGCTPDDIKEENCPRVVILPIAQIDVNGKDYVTITGFAKFFLIDYDKKDQLFSGYFLDEVDDSSVSGGVPKYEYFTKSVKLIK
jgi:Flp pilus assembly protein TadG